VRGLTISSNPESAFYRQVFRVAALAGASLLLEGSLTRLLAVAQFYHFAFLVVSLALLGFGASGSLLTVFPGLAESSPGAGEDPRHLTRAETTLILSGWAFAISVGLAYLVVNLLPFDSYSIAWERKQIFYFGIYYLGLALPFLFSGLGIGSALAAHRGRSHLIYAANLLGSGLGVLLAPLALWLGGVPGAVLASALLGLLAAVGGGTGRRGVWDGLARGLFIAGLVAFAVISRGNLGNDVALGMNLSQYKGLAQALRYPGSHRLFGRWNAISRVDVIADAGTRQLPGLSYTYAGIPPPQHGLSLDADALQPISLVTPGSFEAAAYLPEALAFELRAQAKVMVLNPGGGLGVLQALAGGASQVTAVLDNSLTALAVSQTASQADIYSQARVSTVYDTERVFLRRTHDSYRLIFVPLTDAYRPFRSGAYSLSETYGLTVEAFMDMLARLSPDGVLVISRWLQTPPSESLRLIATLAEAMQRRGLSDPGQAIVAYRGIQTMTVLVAPQGWGSAELTTLREFTTDRRFDLVWAPDIIPSETNRFNHLPEPSYYQEVQKLFTTTDRQAYYSAYPFAVTPPSDNQPFFFHFFRWGQTPELLATLGRTWQPFGGSGYFVLLALLALVILLSLVLILGPLALASAGQRSSGFEVRSHGRALVYFTLIGLAFLFVEIPLIQRWILLLGHPTYAFTVVVLALLASSSVGSALARVGWIPKRTLFAALLLMVLLVSWLVNWLSGSVLGWPFLIRACLALFSLVPLGVLMGLPFPLGLNWLEQQAPDLVPWAWAVNGCASVVASVLAAILALSYGFTLVLLLGALAYAGAFFTLHRSGAQSVPRPG
jgi:hypothetical protein